MQIMPPYGSDGHETAEALATDILRLCDRGILDADEKQRKELQRISDCRG